MKLKPFVIPEKVEIETETVSDTYTKFIIAPLEKGWGHTIGNSLRRSLLSSIQGAAVTQVRIDGVLHEFSTIPDVLEDVPQIIMNIKKIRMALLAETPKFCYLNVKGKGTFTAKDMTVPPEITIANPTQPILTITDAKRSVNIEMKVENGRGYVPAERLKRGQNVPVGTIFLDAFFSPVKKVSYTVENTRVADRSDFEKIILEVWTDGSVKPDEALIQSATIIKNHMAVLIPAEKEPEFRPEERFDKERERLRGLLEMDIDELELSNRALNCLKKGRSKRTGERISIKKVADLVRLSEKEMLNIENFGKKSLDELKKVLEGIGLSFGMDVDSIIKKE
uniref:DNA-directed RNA polymerase subunit alpha n=1 Tax=candidate division WOR-3 bacterium TaxID=2052148 RepID=A0A7C6EAY4_UNCW3